MKRLAGQHQMFHKVMEMDDSADVLRAVTADDVARLTQKIVQPGRFNTLTYGTKHVNGLRRLPLEF